MKSKLLSFGLLVLTVISFSCKKELLPGESRGGGGSSNMTYVPQPLPTFFKRNNGNGTCGGSAQIRLVYAVQPTTYPTLIAIYNSPVGMQLGQPLNGFTFGAGVSGGNNNNAYTSYCIFGGNIPPANALVLKFKYPETGQWFLVSQEGTPYIL